MGIAFLLTIVFIVMQIAGIISWSWIAILSPIIIVLAFYLIVILIILLLGIKIVHGSDDK